MSYSCRLPYDPAKSVGCLVQVRGLVIGTFIVHEGKSYPKYLRELGLLSIKLRKSERDSPAYAELVNPGVRF